MNKIIQASALLALLTQYIGSWLFPNSASMWLSSTSVNFAVLRGALIVLSLILLCTRPPRNTILRCVVGFVGLGLLTWAGPATYNNHMMILDSMLMIGLGIIFTVTAIERTPRIAGSNSMAQLPITIEPQITR